MNGRILARNSVLNLAAQVTPLVVAVVAIPPLMRGLGVERFGILTLAWAAIGYFSLFEFGLARALTQAVAQRLGKGDGEDLPAVAWTALLMMLCLGVVGAVVLASLTPLLVTRVLNVPPELRQEAMQAFYILAASLPLVLMSAGLRGVLEAHQHFGVVAALRIPVAVLMFLGPVAVLPFSRSLVPAVSLLALARLISWAGHLAFCIRRYEFLRQGLVIRRDAIVPLLRFGGWATVSNVVSPMMDFLDRFLIGALLPLAAVAHYVTPYELIVKVLIIPNAILGAMFPAFASTYLTDRTRMARLYERSIRVVILVTFPLVLVGIALAHEGLQLWVGSVLPRESTLVLQWLAVGVFINGIAQAPFAALQGAGRPDLIAKLHVLELPLYGAGIFLLVRELGLPGVAIAWTLRVSFDTIGLIVISRKWLGIGVGSVRAGSAVVGAMLAAYGAVTIPDSAVTRAAIVVALLVVFLPFGWLALLTHGERLALLVWVRGQRRVSPSGEGAA